MNPQSKTSHKNGLNHMPKVQGLSKTKGLDCGLKNTEDGSASPAIETLMAELANQLEIHPDALGDWVKEHTSVPDAVIQHALLLSKRYTLNPLFHHIAIESDGAQGWQVYISIDGWIDLLWRQKSLTGITFKEGPTSNQGVPVWMQCSIYRSDLRKPITVREYLVEAQTSHIAWTQMPRRMLRHKVLQQCARLAFGISDSFHAYTAPNPTQAILFSRAPKQGNQDPKLLLKNHLESLHHGVK